MYPQNRSYTAGLLFSAAAVIHHCHENIPIVIVTGRARWQSCKVIGGFPKARCFRGGMATFPGVLRRVKAKK